MVPIIISIISILLDGLLTNYLPYEVGNLSLFTPLLTFVSIFIIYPFYRKNEYNYILHLFILGIIYDLLYTNLLFFNGILFMLIGLITIFIYKNYNVGYIRVVIYTIILIFFYESITGLLFYIFNLVPITLEGILYKIYHSIILNIIYVELLFIIIKLLPKKYKRISIN